VDAFLGMRDEVLRVQHDWSDAPATGTGGA